MDIRQPAEELSMEQFLQLPNTIDIIYKYSEAYDDFVRERPYIRTGKIAGDYVIAYTQQENLPLILNDIGESAVNIMATIYGLLGQQDLASAGITEVQNQPYLDLKGQGVLVGIIDTGIDYTNKAFIYEDGTSKISYLWDQTLVGNSPEGYFFGTEFTNAQINQAINSDNPQQSVPSVDTIGHGTFLASVAAGRENNEYMGAAPDSELIVVKLRKAKQFYLDYFFVPTEQESAYSSNDILLAVQYVIERAYMLHKPVSICISVGTNFGGHDGLGHVELYLTNLCSIPSVAINTAAGNESAAKHHTTGVIAKEEDFQEIGVIAADNGAPIFVSIWSLSVDNMSVSVTSPTGELVNRVKFKPGITLESKLILEKARVIVEYVFPIAGSGSQLTIVKIINPTPGIWKITLYGDIIINGLYHAWLPITGQIDPQIQFISPDPNFTVVVPATAIGTLTSGAYNSIDNSLYASSSWGPTRLPLASPVMAAPGVNVSGVYPTGYGTMTGTSVSSAIVTGASALMLQWGVVQSNQFAMTSFLIRSYYIKGCIRDINLKYPNNQWGYGRLNLINTFTQMQGN